MLKNIDQYYLKKEEPVKSCLMALRDIIMSCSDTVTSRLSYGMPTFYITGKRFCYLYTVKNTGEPYIGFIDGNKMDHPSLIVENRKRMKIYKVDATIDLPITEIQGLLKQAISATMK